MGVRKTTDFLEKATWGLAIFMVIMSIAVSYTHLDVYKRQDKYKVAVVKREVEFSKETYNRAYNDVSQFIAANPSVEKMVANAEEAGYKLLDRADLYS